MGDTYSHGHHESVLRSHRWRTAENSAGYLLPHLDPAFHLLDVGCGPGTITVGLARLLPNGQVLGIDVSEEVITAAANYAAVEGDPPTNLTFAPADAYHLDAADESFDVVHAHQVLQHLTDPVAALREWRRVLRPGGLIAARDSDYAAFVWAPADPRLTRWLELYHQLTAANDAEADAGRYLLGWAHAAGFADVTYSSSTWTYADADSCAWWGGMWADRVVSSSFATQALGYNLTTTDELAGISAAFRQWADHPDATFVIVHGEILARKPT